MKRILIILYSCLSVSLMGCTDSMTATARHARSKEAKVDQSYEIGEISTLDISYPCIVRYRVTGKGELPSMMFNYNGKDPDSYKIKYSKGTLKVSIAEKTNSVNGNSNLILYINSTMPEQVHIKSAADVRFENEKIHAGSLLVKDSGASSIKFNGLEVDNRFDVSVSGASSLEVKSVATQVSSIGVSGASSFKCPDMDIETLTANCSGASTMDIAVKSINLSLDSSGCSSIDVTGKAAKAVLTASGVANIDATGLTASSMSINKNSQAVIKASGQQQQRRSNPQSQSSGILEP